MTEEEIIEQIIKARKWAKVHFNVLNAKEGKLFDPDTLEILPPSFFIEFPDVDRMVVTPSFLGTRSIISFEYRLAFNPLQWEGKHPFWGYSLAPLVIK